MNHDLIEALVECYEEIPQPDQYLAVREIAVIIEVELRKLEESGELITRETLLINLKDNLAKSKKAA